MLQIKTVRNNQIKDKARSRILFLKKFAGLIFILVIVNVTFTIHLNFHFYV